MGFRKFWKVMEIENFIFQDLESFGKARMFKMTMDNIWFCVWKNSKIPYNGCSLVMH